MVQMTEPLIIILLLSQVQVQLSALDCIMYEHDNVFLALFCDQISPENDLHDPSSTSFIFLLVSIATAAGCTAAIANTYISNS